MSVRWQKMALLVCSPINRFSAMFANASHLLKGRLTRCPFVVSYVCLCSPVKMVYFFFFLSVCLLLWCRPLHLLPTVFGFARERIFNTNAQSKNQTSNLRKSFKRSTSPALLQNRCYRWFRFI